MNPPQNQEPKPRPTRRDDAIVTAVATSLAPNVLAWIGDDDTALADIAEDIKRVIKFGREDGYEIARELEREFGYSPDSALVDILDRASAILYGALKKASVEWVAETGAKP